MLVHKSWINHPSVVASAAVDYSWGNIFSLLGIILIHCTISTCIFHYICFIHNLRVQWVFIFRDSSDRKRSRVKSFSVELQNNVRNTSLNPNSPQTNNSLRSLRVNYKLWDVWRRTVQSWWYKFDFDGSLI